MATEEAALQVRLQHHTGALALDVNFTARAPWTVLFGPSGSGKTTILRAIAGFLLPDDGRIAVTAAGRPAQVLLDRAAGTAVPAHRRPVRTAGQRAQMFARRTVRENVRYGGAGREDLVDEALAQLFLMELAENRVERLSGGEQQRVAVARAIVAARAAGPGTWLLLDEPFTGLELGLRGALTREMPAWFAQLGHPVLSVTHDVAEVFTLNADVIRLSNGRVVRTGSADQVLAEDRARLIAELHA